MKIYRSLVSIAQNSFNRRYGDNGLIGPDEGEIVDKMLDGSKPVCELTFPYDRDDINTLMQAVRNGQLSMMTSDNGPYATDIYGNTYTTYFFCQPGRERDMERVAELFQIDDTTLNGQEFIEHNQEAGQLLGYSEEDVDRYIAWNKSPEFAFTKCLNNVLIHFKNRNENPPTLEECEETRHSFPEQNF